jgi:hypothetical protein
MLMAALSEADGMTDAFLICAHANGDSSWHSTTDTLHVKIGLVEQARWKLKQAQEKMEAVEDDKDEVVQ